MWEATPKQMLGHLRKTKKNTQGTRLAPVDAAPPGAAPPGATKPPAADEAAAAPPETAHEKPAATAHPAARAYDEALGGLGGIREDLKQIRRVHRLALSLRAVLREEVCPRGLHRLILKLRTVLREEL